MVTSASEGGASLGILSGFVAGNFSAYYLGLAMVFLMSIGFIVSTLGLANLMLAPAVFAFGLVAFGFLGMGPVTIAVDSYGPVTDNAQSVYELSLIEQVPNVKEEIKKEFDFDAEFRPCQGHAGRRRRRGQHLQGHGQAGADRHRRGRRHHHDLLHHHGAHPRPYRKRQEMLSLLHAPFFLGLVTGGAVIFWFAGASTQAVSTGAYRAVEFIKANIKLESTEKASVSDSKKVVAICTQYAQKGMLNIFIAVFFATLAFAFVEPFFFIGYLISIAIFGLYQAIFMANAGAAWDNAKKIVEVELKQKGTRAARRNGGGRYGGRPVQGHVFRGAQPGHQIHHALRPPGGGVGRQVDRHQRFQLDAHFGSDFLRRIDLLRLSVVLRNAHWRHLATDRNR